MSNAIKFKPGDTKPVDGTVDPKEAVVGMSQKQKSLWRIERLKAVIRSKPSGYPFKNTELAKALGMNSDVSFLAFRYTNLFAKEFTYTKYDHGHGYIYTIKEDVKLTKTFAPTYTPPTKAEEPAGRVEEQTVIDESSILESDILNVAKDIALEKLARQLTVGELLDGMKEKHEQASKHSNILRIRPNNYTDKTTTAKENA